MSLCHSFIISGRQPNFMEIIQKNQTSFFFPGHCYILQNHHHCQLWLIFIDVEHNLLTINKLQNCHLTSRGIERLSNCLRPQGGFGVKLRPGSLLPSCLEDKDCCLGSVGGICLTFVYLADEVSPLVASPDTEQEASFQREAGASSIPWHMSHLSLKEETPWRLACPLGTSWSRWHRKDKSSPVICLSLYRDSPQSAAVVAARRDDASHIN